MADSPLGPASFWTQADALLRKNLAFQKRNIISNVRLVVFPFLLCLLLLMIQTVVNRVMDKPESRCGCICVDTDGDGKCERKCGLEYSTAYQAWWCQVASPPQWSPLLQIAAPQYRAVQSEFVPSLDLPDDSCRTTGSCPTTILLTGRNLTLGKSLGANMIPGSLALNLSDIFYTMADNVLGSESMPWPTFLVEPAFFSKLPIYYLQKHCSSNSSVLVPIKFGSRTYTQELSCVQGLNLWRNSSSEINDELYKGYSKGNPKQKINEIVAAYDFLDTSATQFKVSIWYNSSYRNWKGNIPISAIRVPLSAIRVPRSVNLASNAYLQFLLGPGFKILFEFVKDMPNQISQRRQELSTTLGPVFFTWVILQLFPVILVSLVYEKEQRLRIMMKMHGLGNGPYWMISYFYFLLLSSVYMIVFVTSGSLIGLKFFTLNDYSIQLVLYFLYINLQISMAFLVSALFSSVRTASVVGYIIVFGTGLLGGFLFQFFLQSSSFPRGWITVMELFPGFALYRGLYDFAQYCNAGYFMETVGMRWKNLNDEDNGMKEVLIIISVELLVVLFMAFYVDQLISSGRSPTVFIQNLWKKPHSLLQKPCLDGQASKDFVQMEKPGVLQEREKVEQLLLDSSPCKAIVCDNLKKVYSGRDGNPKKLAVRGLSLALARGECFGVLGPNGAGKTSFINMMTGIMNPSSGTAYVEGFDIRTHMTSIYKSMGVCPQHDLLWETLTGREHLLFYGRLKNLKGAALTRAVEESLKSVNLFHGGVADRQAGKYSGGMKRRLSVAISLIGNPQVVYMDEPSTGLDPASRNNLWNVVLRAKKQRAIILTTHSMEEAEHLCDRLGIFVDGSLECIGNPKELKATYRESHILTMTTPANQEAEVENLVRQLSPSAIRIYQISGTQKFELPKNEVKLADIFQAVDNAKGRLTVHAWGLADTTLEDVFVKVAAGAHQVSKVQT